jgi:hypothetical protein
VLETLPFAIAIAASPFPIIRAILLLFTARPRPTSLAFLAGWLLGIVSATTVFVLLSEVVESGESSPTWVSWVRLVIGAVLRPLGVARGWLTTHNTAVMAVVLVAIGSALAIKGIQGL